MDVQSPPRQKWCFHPDKKGNLRTITAVKQQMSAKIHVRTIHAMVDAAKTHNITN